VRKFLGYALPLLWPVLVSAQPYERWQGWDGMGPWHMWAGGWGFWWIFPLFMLIFFALCVFFMMGRHRHFEHSAGKPTDSALRILGERFARGEIDKKEYEEKKATLLQ
jgi:putative membrane protein